MANKGLGKGLAALFSEIENQSITSYDSEGNLNRGVSEIDINQIDTNPNQPRKNFDENMLIELSQSVKNYGIIQPIIVAENYGRYIIIAGERRYRAAKMAGLLKIPSIVKNYSEKERKEVAIIENIQREDLNPIEEASAYKTLIEEYGITQDALAATLGRSRPAITNAIRLLQLSTSVKQLVLDGKLSAGHARSLVVVKEESEQYKMAQEVIEKQISVSLLQAMVNDYLSGGREVKHHKEKRQPAEMKAFIADMQRIFATKVRIMGNEKKGKISIDYYSTDDLQRIYDLMDILKLK